MSEDTPEYHVSNRERRLRDSVADLPEPVPTTRDRGDRESTSRHLTTLRQRLDWLVELEDRHGDEQENLHRHRAERNALIWALQQVSALAEGLLPKTSRPPRAPDPVYVRETFERIEGLQADGFTRVDRRRPGQLLHHKRDDAAAVETTLTIWFYFVARQGATAPPGHKAVPIDTLMALATLIDPPPIQVEGQKMMFKNPMAAEMLAKVSAEVRKLIEYAPGQEGEKA